MLYGRGISKNHGYRKEEAKRLCISGCLLYLQANSLRIAKYLRIIKRTG